MPSFPQLSPAVTQENSEIALFQRTVLLTEAMNKFKCHVNKEKHAHHSKPNHLEVVSSDEEEIKVPIVPVPLTSARFYPLKLLMLAPLSPPLCHYHRT